MIAVHVCSEVYPYSRTGMLGDSVFGLAKSLSALNVQTYVISPMYISSGCYDTSAVSKEMTVTVTAGGAVYSFDIYEAQTDGITFIFLRNDEFYCRRYIYGTSSYDYSDNDVRFGMFSLASLEYLRRAGIDADVIHCHEWQTGLVPIYKHLFYNDMKAKTVFTVHDITYQGLFSKFSIQALGLPWEMYNVEELEFYENISMLKGGSSHADYITFPSPTYAEEVKSGDFSFGLGSFMGKFEGRSMGILCGVDYDRFDPQNDSLIAKSYGADTVRDKQINKDDFLTETGLKGADRPLFLLETKFSERKGLELLTDSAEKLSEIEADFAFLGYGDAKYCSKFKEIANNYDNIFTSIGISETMLHKAYAAADFVLRPSLTEPCGKSQLLGMRYGALPVVRRTGGLIDTVKDIDEGGYGFFIDGYSRHDLLKQINRAVEFFADRDIFYKCAANVMGVDFSWRRTAEQYLILYRRLVGGN